MPDWMERDTDPEARSRFRDFVRRVWRQMQHAAEWWDRAIDRWSGCAWRDAGLADDDPAAPHVRHARQVLDDLTDARHALARAEQGVAATEGEIPTRALVSAERDYLHEDLVAAEGDVRPWDRTPDRRGMPRPRQRRVNELRSRIAEYDAWLAAVPDDHAEAVSRRDAARQRVDALTAEWRRATDGDDLAAAS